MKSLPKICLYVSLLLVSVGCWGQDTLKVRKSATTDTSNIVFVDFGKHTHRSMSIAQLQSLTMIVSKTAEHCYIKSFSIYRDNAGILTSLAVQGYQFNSDVAKFFANVKSGDKISFSDINASCADGRQGYFQGKPIMGGNRSLSGITIEVK